MIKEKPIRLAFGELATPEEEISEARGLFLRVIRDRAPDVVRDLRDAVWQPVFSPALLAWRAHKAKEELLTSLDDESRRIRFDLLHFPWPDAVRGAVRDWANRYHLTEKGKVPRWVVAQVESTFHSWDYTPRLMDATLWPCGMGQRLRIPPQAPVPAFDPQYETREQADARWKLSCDEIVRDALAAGLKPAATKRNMSHFEWAVRFQILEEPFQELEGKIKATPPSAGPQRTVRKAVKEVLRMIGLTLRKDRPGRPRKTSGQQKHRNR